MRLAYLGTSKYAAIVLRRLNDSPHRPALVVAPPDSRRGRGRSLKPPPVAEAAAELGLELWQSGNVNEPESLEKLASLELDCLVVCAFGQMIRAELLDAYEILNVHPSILPRWRGAAPIERAIMAGDSETGVAIMQLTAGLDSGPVALLERTPIGPGEDFGSLSPRLAGIGGELLVRALDLRAAGELTFVEQTEEGLTYAEKIDPAERRLDPTRPAVELERIVRGLSPHVGTYLETEGGDRLGVRRVALADPSAVPEGAEILVLAPGELVEHGGRLLLGTGEGWLYLEEVQPAGKKPMDAGAFLRGYPIPMLAG